MAYFQLLELITPFVFLGADFLILLYMLPGLVDTFCDLLGKEQPPRNRVHERGKGVTRDTKLVA